MKKNPGNDHSHQKEYYRFAGQASDFAESCYKKKLYYTAGRIGEPTYLCTTDMDGDHRKILAELPQDMGKCYVHVNETGIYVYSYESYYTGEAAPIIVCRYGLKGDFLGECRENAMAAGILKNLYFYDSDLYYVYTSGGEREKCEIRCLHTESGCSEALYQKASDIKALYAMKDALIFHAVYGTEELRTSGWQLFELSGGRTECLSNPYLNPELLCTKPYLFDGDDDRYDERYRENQTIRFFDLNREIFWIETPDRTWTGAYEKQPRTWSARSLRGDHGPVKNVPDWIFRGKDSYEREYFDGVHHFYAENGWTLMASEADGTEYPLSGENDRHGKCNEFRVHGGLLFADMDAQGEQMYEMVGSSLMILGPAVTKAVPSEELIAKFDKKNPKKPQAEPAPAPAVKPAAKPEPEEAEYREPDFGIELPIICTKVINASDLQYGICKFPSQFHIGFGESVVVNLDGRTYNCKTHNTTKGRVGGFTALYRENGIREGDTLDAIYAPSNHVLTLIRR